VPRLPRAGRGLRAAQANLAITQVDANMTGDGVHA